MRPVGRVKNMNMKTRIVYSNYTPEELLQLVEQYRSRLELFPEDHGTRYMLGNCLFSLGRPEEGHAEWNILLALDDPFWNAGIQRSRAIVEPKQPPGA